MLLIRLSGLSPRVAEDVAPVRRVLVFLGAAFPGDLHGEVLESGEQGAELFRVAGQGLVFGELVRGEAAGDGLAADLAGPFRLGAVQAGRAGVAAAAGLAAGVGADGEGAGRGQPRRRARQ